MKKKRYEIQFSLDSVDMTVMAKNEREAMKLAKIRLKNRNIIKLQNNYLIDEVPRESRTFY